MGSMLFDGARHKIAQSKIDAARITQNSGNTKRAAESGLEAFNQSLSNSAVLDAAGDRANAIEENLGRNLDAAAMGTLASRLDAAGALGASAAEAAAAGVGGSSVEAYNRTVQLTQDINEEQANRATAQGIYDAGQARGNGVVDAVNSMGRDVIAPNLDYTQYVDDHKQSTLTKIVGTAATVAATYFGGPSAGMAVQNLMQADEQASNGDFAGATSSMNQSYQNASTGWKTFRAGADDTHAGKAWGDGAFDRVKNIFGSFRIH